MISYLGRIELAVVRVQKERSVPLGHAKGQPLIDDEAGNASINTAYRRDEVTRINSQILPQDRMNTA